VGDLSINDHFCSCSVAALNNVSQQSPKQCILDYIGKLRNSTFSSADKKYVTGHRFGYYIHVFFSGPDMRTLKPPGQFGGDHHYSATGSCDRLAAFIREEKLGPVVETEPRWNHRHASTRKPGQGDVICYIWSPDADALEKWWEANKPKGA
jgi:hypothetical protein